MLEWLGARGDKAEGEFGGECCGVQDKGGLRVAKEG